MFGEEKTDLRVISWDNGPYYKLYNLSICRLANLDWSREAGLGPFTSPSNANRMKVTSSHQRWDWETLTCRTTTQCQLHLGRLLSSIVMRWTPRVRILGNQCRYWTADLGNEFLRIFGFLKTFIETKVEELDQAGPRRRRRRIATVADTSLSSGIFQLQLHSWVCLLVSKASS